MHPQLAHSWTWTRCSYSVQNRFIPELYRTISTKGLEAGGLALTASVNLVTKDLEATWQRSIWDDCAAAATNNNAINFLQTDSQVETM